MYVGENMDGLSKDMSVDDVARIEHSTEKT